MGLALGSGAGLGSSAGGALGLDSAADGLGSAATEMLMDSESGI